MAATRTSSLMSTRPLRAVVLRLSGVDDAAVAACAGLTAYIAVLIARGQALSASVFQMSDAPAGAYLGQAFVNGHRITLPLHSELAPTLLSGALLHLPAGHTFVAVLGPAIAVAATAIVCTTLRNLGVRWLFSGVLGFCAGPIILWSFLFPTAHVYTYLAMAVFARAAVRIAADGLRTTAIIACALVGATALAGDQGFLIMGLFPLLAAALAVSLRSHVWRRGGVAGMVAAATIVLAVVLAVLARLRGLHLDTEAAFRGAQGTSSQLLGLGASLAARTFGWMLSGSWFGGSASTNADTLFAVAGLVIPLVAPVALWQQCRRSEPDDRRLAYLAFWVAVDVLVLAAFLGLGYAQSIASGRYLIPCALAAIATAPLLHFPRRRRGRLLAGVGVGLIAVTQAAGLVALPASAFAGPQAPSDAAHVLRVVESQGLTRGYADYWASNPLTWLSGEKVRVFPVIPGCAGSTTLCPYEYASASWYAPSPGASFLLIRAGEVCPFGDVERVLGRPERSFSVDAASTVLVYPYDIATRFATTPSICF